MKETLACLLNGHKPSGLLYHNFTKDEQSNMCLYCRQTIYYSGDILSDAEGFWKTREEIEKLL